MPSSSRTVRITDHLDKLKQRFLTTQNNSLLARLPTRLAGQKRSLADSPRVMAKQEEVVA